MQQGRENQMFAVEYLNSASDILDAASDALSDTKSNKSRNDISNNVFDVTDFQKAEPMGGEERTAAALNTNSNKPILKQVAETKIYESILRELMKYSK